MHGVCGEGRCILTLLIQVMKGQELWAAVRTSMSALQTHLIVQRTQAVLTPLVHTAAPVTMAIKRAEMSVKTLMSVDWVTSVSRLVHSACV